MYALCVSGAVNTQGFVWKFFYALYINFNSVSQSIRDSFKVNLDGAIWFDFWPLSLTSNTNRYDLKQQQQNDLKLVMLISGQSKCGFFLWV